MYLKIFFSVRSKWTGDWNDSLSLPLRSLWCCSSSTHSTPSVTSWWSLLTTWSRSAPGSSSPTWTATSCTPSSSSEWTTARPGWGDTSVSDVCPTLGPYIPYIRPTQPKPPPAPPSLPPAFMRTMHLVCLAPANGLNWEDVTETEVTDDGKRAF